MYAGFPPFTPPSSLYCCQRSVSMISAAARNWRIATSPLVSRLPAALAAPLTPALTPLAQLPDVRSAGPVASQAPGPEAIPLPQVRPREWVGKARFLECSD